MKMSTFCLMIDNMQNRINAICGQQVAKYEKIWNISNRQEVPAWHVAEQVMEGGL